MLAHSLCSASNHSPSVGSSGLLCVSSSLRTLNESLTDTRKSAALPELPSCNFDLYRNSVLFFSFSCRWRIRTPPAILLHKCLLAESFGYSVTQRNLPQWMLPSDDRTHRVLPPGYLRTLSTPFWRSTTGTEYPTVSLSLCTHALRSTSSRQSSSESSTEFWSSRTHNRVPPYTHSIPSW